jgi:histidine triad (HIT) family protein
MSDCIFCKIIEGRIPGKFIYKDENVAAFHDIHPKAPVHVLVVPVKHVESLREVQAEDKELLGELFLKVREIAQKLNIGETGYKIVINNGKNSGQLVYHLHVHLLGGWSQPAHWQV